MGKASSRKSSESQSRRMLRRNERSAPPSGFDVVSMGGLRSYIILMSYTIDPMVSFGPPRLGKNKGEMVLCQAVPISS
jgi:hypothetical protein